MIQPSSPEVNAMLFAAMMPKTPAERLLMASEPPLIRSERIALFSDKAGGRFGGGG
jgi:hypothetical protein